MKKLLIFGFLLIGIAGYSQSKRQVNKQLKAEYAVLDWQVDSLADLYGSEMRTEKQLLDSFKTKTGEMYAQEKVFTDLAAEITKSLDDLNQLGMKLVDGINRPYLDSLLLLLQTNTVSSIVLSARQKEFSAFFGFSKYEVLGIDELSIKDQNDLLLLLINQRKKEGGVVAKQISESIQCKADVLKADSSFDALQVFFNVFRNKITPELLITQEKLEKELSGQRILYTRNGPKGFSDSYKRVFPDVFPEFAPEMTGFTISNLREPVHVKGEDIFIEMDEQAQFPGGVSAMADFMDRNLYYPLEAREMGLEGKCYVKFMISGTGEISDVSVQKGVPDCEICNKEAVRFVKSMPNWSPAKAGGVPVSSYYTLPIVFKLN